MPFLMHASFLRLKTGIPRFFCLITLEIKQMGITLEVKDTNRPLVFCTLETKQL